MVEEPQTEAQDPKKVGKADGDRTGRDRLVSNVFFSWGGQFVFIIAGFIMPRMIDMKLGQEALGVWDFAWSLTAYFQWVEAGIICSVNRYVGRYWANQDIASINRVVSSATCVLGAAGLLVFAMAAGLSALLPKFFGTKLGSDLFATQAVVFLLGAGIAVQTVLGAFNGVVTGCHRWDLLNINRSGWYLATFAAMIISMMLGGGLLHLAVITFLGEVSAQITRMILAFRICKGLRLGKSSVQWATITELYAYGAKILIPSVSGILLNSTASMLIVSYLGPAALALFTRPRSLIRQVDTLVRRMTMTLIPTTSSLEGAGDVEAIRNLLVKSVRYTLYLVLPYTAVVTIFGGPVIHLWMGPRYANDLLVALLALGALAPMVQSPVMDILAGLNAHGRAGISQFIASVISIGLLFLAIGPLDSGLIGAAIAISLPLAIVNGIYVPLTVCRKVGMNLKDYFIAATKKPALHILPFTICLVIARIVFKDAPMAGLGVGLAVGGPMLAVVYWKHVLPSKVKNWALRFLGKSFGSKGLSGAKP